MSAEERGELARDYTFRECFYVLVKGALVQFLYWKATYIYFCSNVPKRVTKFENNYIMYSKVLHDKSSSKNRFNLYYIF